MGHQLSSQSLYLQVLSSFLARKQKEKKKKEKGKRRRRGTVKRKMKFSLFVGWGGRKPSSHINPFSGPPKSIKRNSPHKGHLNNTFLFFVFLIFRYEYRYIMIFRAEPIPVCL